MGPRHELDCQVRRDLPSLAQVASDTVAIAGSERVEKPRGASRIASSTAKPLPAASAASTPSIADRPAWYSRATLVLAAAYSQPMEVAASASARAAGRGGRPRSLAAATAPPKMVITHP
jgi:hypothetical protein